MMTVNQQAERTLELLRASDALLEGHFLLSSGRHAGRYIQCARLLQYPERAAEACSMLAARIRETAAFDVVVGPAMGAVTMGYELARAMGTRGLFAERVQGGFALRRGFEIQPGERVLVAEDVVTTGKSVKEVLVMLTEMGVTDMAVASLVNRSGVDNPFADFGENGVPYFSLVPLDVPNWSADECPLCTDDSQGPAIKPGSRPGL
ncbi:MAG: orotate phosphoribosyltransferase [Planctomycetes bacterium]|jgi:orotate phosphoribosyltransferase|nr:orotate phosphoribosyltransferase [Planctomycetota bacterium]MBT4029623.1 orotate phosphoribosyltransferase [Planctomycetota bacterium]MBT4560182.1 orotate phosphoribosyltransferase [Planctomycetota bacterium]MBT5100894.1 orotate phosphoribosyltransferase [Planctomycetota bacterium]MBT7011517.1 orotate phosphoribosyltransferase [Planctomycetota bacterium]